MNRIVIAALLALIAVGAGAVWAIGQFGGSANPVISEPREPIVREPEIVAAVERAAQPQAAPLTTPIPAKPKPQKANPAPAKPSTPEQAPAAEPKAEVTPAPVTEPAATPETPATQSAKSKNPLDTLKARVEKEIDKEIDKVKPPAATPTPSSSLAQASPQPGAAAVEPQAAPATPAAEPNVTTQNVTTQNVQAPAKPSANARVATPVNDTVQPAAVPGVTQMAAPVGLEAQFKSRRVTYNRPPAKLALNKPVDVSLVVNATADETAGKEALEGFKGEVVERDVELSDTVSAQLTGAGFDITSQTVERQRLSGRTVNRWQWRVTPTEEGEHTLMLEIFGYATGSLDAEPLDAYRDVIAVEVEQLDQIVSWAKGVQPLFAVLAALAGIGSACFAFLRFREEKKQTKAMGTKGE